MSTAAHCLGARRLRTLSRRTGLDLVLAYRSSRHVAEGVTMTHMGCRHYRIDPTTGAVEIIQAPTVHWTSCRVGR